MLKQDNVLAVGQEREDDVFAIEGDVAFEGYREGILTGHAGGIASCAWIRLSFEGSNGVEAGNGVPGSGDEDDGWMGLNHCCREDLGSLGRAEKCE